LISYDRIIRYTFLVKKKNNETDFFLYQSMPNFNFTEAFKE
jgi:hypothetical protein